MVYAKAFFDLQLQFADKVTELSGLPFTRVLLEYTNLYIRFGLGRDFHPAHPIWQAYLAGLQDTNDRREWTYRFYLTRAEADGRDHLSWPPLAAFLTRCCAGTASASTSRMPTRRGTLPSASTCLGQRRADLTALFGHVQRTLSRAGPGGGGVVAVQSRGVSSPISRSRTSRRRACSVIDFSPCRSGGNFWIGMGISKRA